MRKLRLVGLSADGRDLVLADETGAEFATPADERLRAALRGDRARLGQLEIQMDIALRPRDIQARIRAGQSPESVAAIAQVPVDRILSFCLPVLAERQHVAELARRHHVRRKGAEGPSKTLDALIDERLRSRGIDPSSILWDSWRRDDGRWDVRAGYRSGEHERAAMFVFDSVGRYSLAGDDEARWLTGERQSTSKGPQPREPGRAGERRLAAVGADDLLTVDDSEDTDDLTAVMRALRDDDPPQDHRATVSALPITQSAHSEDTDEAEGDADAGLDVRDAGLEVPAPEAAAPEAAAPEAADLDADELDGPARDAGELDAGELDAGELDDRTRDDGSPENDAGVGAPDADVEAAIVMPPDASASQVLPSGPAARRGHLDAERSADQRRRSTRRASVPSWDEIMLGTARDDL